MHGPGLVSDPMYYPGPTLKILFPPSLGSPLTRPHCTSRVTWGPNFSIASSTPSINFNFVLPATEEHLGGKHHSEPTKLYVALVHVIEISNLDGVEVV
ncbi:hypothetical protein BDZ97DRAFT_201664 [Flammula alnicola]|nr:hypothetical protein BDZ97DRAFT_201664 [Flammula alnicola]